MLTTEHVAPLVVRVASCARLLCPIRRCARKQPTGNARNEGTCCLDRAAGMRVSHRIMLMLPRGGPRTRSVAAFVPCQQASYLVHHSGWPPQQPGRRRCWLLLGCRLRCCSLAAPSRPPAPTSPGPRRAHDDKDCPPGRQDCRQAGRQLPSCEHTHQRRRRTPAAAEGGERTEAGLGAAPQPQRGPSFLPAFVAQGRPQRQMGARPVVAASWSSAAIRSCGGQRRSVRVAPRESFRSGHNTLRRCCAARCAPLSPPPALRAASRAPPCALYQSAQHTGRRRITCVSPRDAKRCERERNTLRQRRWRRRLSGVRHGQSRTLERKGAPPGPWPSPPEPSCRGPSTPQASPRAWRRSSTS